MEISFDRDLTESFASFNTPYFTNANNAETVSCNSRTHSASRTVLNHDRAYVKPMMSGGATAKGGYSEEDGFYAEFEISAKWGEPNRAEGRGKENSSRSDRESHNRSGEVNATDRS